MSFVTKMALIFCIYILCSGLITTGLVSAQNKKGFESPLTEIDFILCFLFGWLVVPIVTYKFLRKRFYVLRSNFSDSNSLRKYWERD